MKKKIFAILLTLCMVLTMMPSMAWAEEQNDAEGTQGLAVMQNGALLGDGAEIEIEENSLCEMRIYYNGKALEPEEDPIADPLNEEICYPGVSPDGEVLEIRISETAEVGATDQVTLQYKEEVLHLKIKVIAGLRLKLEDGTIVKKERTISGKQSVTAQVMLGNDEITEDYDFGIESSAVLHVENLGKGKLKITTTGNGSSTLTVVYGKQNNGESWKKESIFTWKGSGVKDGADARNLVLEIDGSKKQTGARITLWDGKSLTGKVSLNGEKLESQDYHMALLDGPGCTLTTNSDGSFTLTAEQGVKGWFTLECADKAEKENRSWEARFSVRVRTVPSAYYLQFCNMEKQGDTWATYGYATIGIFKNTKQKKYVKYIVTDEDMDRIDDDYFVNVTPENIKVQYCIDFDQEKYVDVEDECNPFSFEMVNGEDNLMKISYDRAKDLYGPAYRLVYTGDDEYLKPENDKNVTKHIFLWTRSVRELVSLENLKKGEDGQESDHWIYDARKASKEGFEETNEECDIKLASVAISKDLFGEDENQVSIKQDQTTLELQTNLGTVTFDDKVLTQIDQTNQQVTLNIENIEKEDDAYQSAETQLQNATKVVDLSLQVDDGSTISQFGAGTAAVTLDYEMQDSSKEPKVYYLAENGEKTPVVCEYDAAAKELTLETNHFSTYVVEEAAKISGGASGGAIAPTPSDVTTSGTADDKVTTAKTDVKTSEKTNADGTKETVAEVKVSAANQKEIIKQAKQNGSKEIILEVPASAVGGATSANVQLEKAFLDQLTKETNASLTIRTPFGDTTYTQDELKALLEKADDDTVTLAVSKADPAAEEAERIAQAKAAAKQMSMKARSTKTSKGIKVVFKTDAESKAFIESMKELGYTVKYRFYRSTKKASGYKAMLTKKTISYTNTSGKQGMKYYYKVQVRIYDQNGKLVTKTALKQCKYACRTWTR